MDRYPYSAAIVLAISFSILASPTTATDAVVGNSGILMPDVKLLGSMPGYKSTQPETTIITARKPAPASTVVPPDSTKQKQRSEPVNNKVINQAFAAFPSKSPTPAHSNKRYNGYLKSRKQLSVWLGGLRVEAPGIDSPAMSIEKPAVVLHKNGSLMIQHQTHGTHSFMPGQLMPEQLMPEPLMSEATPPRQLREHSPARALRN